MHKDTEPAPVNNEHSKGTGEVFTFEWSVEGIVISTVGSRPQYIVTKVLDGHETVYPGEYRYQQLSSPNRHLALSPEDVTEYSYRGLIAEEYYRPHTNLYPGDADNLEAPNGEASVGDRIKVVRWSREVPYEYETRTGTTGTSTRTEYTENVTILETGIDIPAEENRIVTHKEYVRKNFAGIIRRLEKLQLSQGNRLRTDIQASIEWKRRSTANGEDFYRGEFVYGEGSIEDHFVRVRAVPYVPTIDMPVNGDIRFTQAGAAFLQRDITAGEPSKELALINEPMIELTARLWTETVTNPAVDAAHIDFIINGIRYTGLKDVETSSHYFKEPGHHHEFNNFSTPGDGFDGLKIKPEEMDALYKYKSIIRSLKSRAAQIGAEARVAQGELGEKPSSEISSSPAQIRELEMASKKALLDIQPVIDEIEARPSDPKMGGSRLLVPKSKLNSVRVIIGLRST